MLYQPSGRKRRSPQRHKYTKECHRLAPSSINPPRSSRVTIVGTTTAIATHTTSQNHCAWDGRDTIDTCCVPGSDIATVWECPVPAYTHTHTDGDAQTTHRSNAIVLCAFRRPACPQCNAIGQHQAGMQPQQRKHIGTRPPYGEDTPGRRQVQRKGERWGTSTKGSVLIMTCVPLPHLVLPLSGCACSSTPTMATRGEARGHPW